MKNTEITNGVILRHFPSDKFKTVLVSVSIYQKTGNGTVPAMFAQLVGSGSPYFADRTDMQSEFDRLYGTTFGTGNAKNGDLRETRIHFTALADEFVPEGSAVSDAAKTVTAIIEEIIDGNVSEELFNKEKRLLREQIVSLDGDKRLYARARAEEETCKGEPFGVRNYGTVEALDGLTAEELKSGILEAIKTAPIIINVFGNTDTDKLAECLKPLFAKIGREYTASPEPTLKKAKETVTVIDKMPVEQGKLVMAYRSDEVDKSSGAFSVFSDMFGGGVHSRLFLYVREAKSLCYYCSARGVKSKGLIFVESGVETEKAEAAKNAIEEELLVIKSGKFTDEELETSKRSLIDTYKTICDDQTVLLSWYSMRGLDGEVLSPEEYGERVKKVTREEIIKTANSFLLDTVYILASEDK